MVVLLLLCYLQHLVVADVEQFTFQTVPTFRFTTQPSFTLIRPTPLFTLITPAPSATPKPTPSPSPAPTPAPTPPPIPPEVFYLGVFQDRTGDNQIYPGSLLQFGTQGIPSLYLSQSYARFFMGGVEVPVFFQSDMPLGLTINATDFVARAPTVPIDNLFSTEFQFIGAPTPIVKNFTVAELSWSNITLVPTTFSVQAAANERLTTFGMPRTYFGDETLIDQKDRKSVV